MAITHNKVISADEAASAATEVGRTEWNENHVIGALTIGTTEIAADAVTNDKIRDSAAVSIIGRSANSSGGPADIAAGSNGQYLSRQSNAIAFGSLLSGDLAGFGKVIVDSAGSGDQTTISAAIAASTHVVVGPGTFSNTDATGDVSNLVIDGSGPGTTIWQIPASAIAGEGLVSFSGSAASGDAINNAAINDVSVTLNPTTNYGNYAVGDTILIGDSTDIDPENVGTRKEAELAVILAKPGAGAFTLEAPLMRAYTSTPTVYLITMRKNITLKNITLKSAQTASTFSAGSGQVLFKFCENVTLDNVVFDNMWVSALQFWSCKNVTVLPNCRWNKVNPVSDLAYAVSIRGACTGLKLYGQVNDTRHAFTLGGGGTGSNAGRPSNIDVEMTSVGSTEGHFDAHYGGGRNINFNNCRALGVRGDNATNTVAGYSFRSPVKMSNCDSVGNTQAVHLHAPTGVGEGASGTVIKGGKFTHTKNTSATDAIIRADANVANVVIDGVVMEKNECKPIDTASTLGTGWQIINNYIDAADQTVSGECIEVAGNAWIIKNNIVKNNTTGAGKPITINASITGTRIKGNNFAGNTSNAPLLTSTDTTHIIEDNEGYNDQLTAITNPFRAATGDLDNLAQAQAFPASTAVYTAKVSPKIVTITGGTVTVIKIDGITLTGVIDGTFYLRIGQSIAVTHSVNPTATVRLA